MQSETTTGRKSNHILHFTKMHGTGNDFVVLNLLAHPLPADFDFTAAAQQLCARRYGVGADGLLTVEPPEPEAQAAGAAVRMRMWNPDGTVDMCGNGLRCVSKLAHHRHVAQNEFIVQTLARPRTVAIQPSGLVRVGMGQPSFHMQDIPLQPPAEEMLSRPIEYALPLSERKLQHVTSLSTGTAHTVIFTPALPDDESFFRLSPLIEHHPWFPERTSIMWAHVVDQHAVELRIWERGAGETLACGTGACATAVAAQVTERCGEDVAIRSRGGELRIHWRRGQEIQMTGPAAIVFNGVWHGGF